MGSYEAPPYLRDNVSTVFVLGNCGIDITFCSSFHIWHMAQFAWAVIWILSVVFDPESSSDHLCVDLPHLSNVNLSEDRPVAIADADFVGLVSLRSLSLNHCSLTTLDTLKGN